ncbi:MAG: right-handed parallel beta-helix repeat-containing protein [Pirellulaceae bacterium]
MNSCTALNPNKLIADTTGAKTGDAGDVIMSCSANGLHSWRFQVPAHYQITGFKFRRSTTGTGNAYGPLLDPTFGLSSPQSSSYAFTDCTFENLYLDCYAVKSPGVSFTNCTSSGNKYIGLYLDRTAAIIKNCTFKDQLNQPIYSVGSTSTCEVTDSFFTNNIAYGLYTSGIASLKCTNNVFTNTRYSLVGSANTVDVSNCAFSLTDPFSRANWGNYAAWIGSPIHGAVTFASSTVSGYQVGAYVMSNDVAMTSVNITGMGTNYYNPDWTVNGNWLESYGIVATGSPGSGGSWNNCKRFKYTGTSGTISNCYIGIHANSADVTVENATIAGQIYGLYGTGGYSPGNKLTLTNTTIKDCLWSGAAFNQAASLNATNSKFLSNGVNQSDGGWAWGWGLYFYGYKPASANYWDGVPGDASLTVQNCEFTGNGNGFCVASLKKELITLSGNTVDGGLVMNGTTPASHYGWGACLSNGDYALQNNAEFSIENCYYGLGTQYGKFSVTNYAVQDNYHAIVAQTGSTLTVANCSATANSGAGVYSAQGTSVSITNSDLSGNGYGFRDDNSNAVSIWNSTASNNLYDGILAESTDALVVERCKVLNNGNWGLFSNLTQSAAIKNNVVAGNKYGARLGDSGTGADVWNNTICNNTTSYGVYASSGTVKVHNNIIAGNGAYGLGSDQATLIHSHNLISGHAPGTDFWKTGLSSTQAEALRTPDEPSKPPRFVDPAANDFRLAKGSPAINAGLNAPGIVDTDLLGNARPMFVVTEMGAYEYLDKSGSVRPLTWNERK